MKILFTIITLMAQAIQIPPAPRARQSVILETPLPGGRPAVSLAITTAATVPVIISWDPNPPDQLVTLYTVQIATSVTGPFNPIISATNTSVVVNLTRPLNRYFIQVIPTDWWGQQPTNGTPLTVMTPASATPVQNIRVSK